MQIIRVETFKGRTGNQKRELVKALTETFVRVAGGKRDGLHVVNTEVDVEVWGAGGELCADKLAGARSS